MIIPYICEFCGHKFYSKIGTTTLEKERKEKYDHLRTHPEYAKRINKFLDNYSHTKKLVTIPIKIPEYPQNDIHSFVDIVYDSEKDGQLQAILVKFDLLLSKYGLLLEKQEKNVVRRKTLNNFFTFIAELEVIDAIKKTFSNVPEIVKSNNDFSNDFILDNMYFEVKCPLETNRPIHEYITDWKRQRQLANISENKIKILIIKTDYRYPHFPIFDAGIKRALSGDVKHLFWNCCITYNPYHKRGDFYSLNITNAETLKLLTLLKDQLVIY